jgi:hypothetical protein
MEIEKYRIVGWNTCARFEVQFQQSGRPDWETVKTPVLLETIEAARAVILAHSPNDKCGLS